MSIDKENKESLVSPQTVEKTVSGSNKKKYVALESTKITCNSVFELIKGEEIPSGIDKVFIQSLLDSNLIK